MIEENIWPDEEEALAEFLSGVDLFASLNNEALADLIKSMTVVVLEGGETLINQADMDSSLYIVYKGRLRVYETKGPNQKTSETIAEISSGEIVGEVTLFLDKPRNVIVRAVRDCIILKLTQKAFKIFEKKDPQAVVKIAKIAMGRMVSNPKQKKVGEDFNILTIAPAGDSDHRRYAFQLADELAKIKSVLLIDQEFCNRHFKRDIAQTMMGNADHVTITNWLHFLENLHDIIIYVTDHQFTPWTQRCLRQADRIQFVSDTTTLPVMNDIESAINTNFFSIVPLMELILVHPDNQVYIHGTKAWLKDRNIAHFHHVRVGMSTDMHRVIRLLLGQNLGVVLNGGGAWGFAHIGVLKALHEMKVAVDYIGGCSAGAAIAGMYAHYHDVDAIIELSGELQKGFRKDYTVPFISLLNGTYIVICLKKLYGETLIEDLWVPFYCVSSNVTKGKLHIHKSGMLWQAVRASLSIPAIYPPSYNEDGDLLVDGGIIDNMPVDVMRDLQLGGKILAVNCHKYSGDKAEQVGFEEPVSGWSLLLNKINPVAYNTMTYNSLGKVLLSALGLAGNDRQELMAKQADYLLQLDTSNYGLLDAKPAYELIDLGYRTAIEQLPAQFSNKF